jgi:large subunit ribosomal protein L5
MLNFREQYFQVIRPTLLKDNHYSNPHAVPSLDKIVLNMGLGKKMQDKAVREAAIKGLADISGQFPCITYAKQSIAGFKIREKMELGLKVTLRGGRMYDFFQRFLYIAMPRIRDFRGVSSRSFDGLGNFSMGIKEHHIFPEINYDKVTDLMGMDVTIVTTAQTDDEARVLLEHFGMPFRR